MSRNTAELTGFNDGAAAELAGQLLKTNKISFRAENDESDPLSCKVRVKLINRFNYVTHVCFTITDEHILQEYECDGAGRCCRRFFCEHCMAAYKYLNSSGNFPVRIISAPEGAEPEVS